MQMGKIEAFEQDVRATCSMVIVALKVAIMGNIFSPSISNRSVTLLCWYYKNVFKWIELLFATPHHTNMIMGIKTLCGWNLQWIFQLICLICSFSEHLPCSDTWDQVVNNAAGGPNAQDHSGYQRAKGIAQSGVKEVRVGDPGPHSFPEKKHFLFPAAVLLTPALQAQDIDPDLVGHCPSPLTGTITMTGLPASLASLYCPDPYCCRVGLPWLWVCGWHHPHLQLQRSFVCTWKIPFPRQCPVPKSVFSTILLITSRSPASIISGGHSSVLPSYNNSGPWKTRWEHETAHWSWWLLGTA